MSDNLPEMVPPVSERLYYAHKRAGGYSEAIERSFRDGALAERARIVEMLLEPSEAMIDAATAESVKHTVIGSSAYFSAIWRAMINAALANLIEGKP